MTSVEAIKGLKENQCVVDILLKEAAIHSCKNCGKCVFGYEGVTQLELILKDITEKKGKSSDLTLLQELSELMKTQSLCDDSRELAEAALLAVSNHKEVFEEHIAKKNCCAGVCKKFMTYHILAEKCVGCGDCIDVCEDDAIIGKKKFVHIIDQNECILCGNCMDACEEAAIVMAGAVKPRCPKKPIPCKKR